VRNSLKSLISLSKKPSLHSSPLQATNTYTHACPLIPNSFPSNIKKQNLEDFFLAVLGFELRAWSLLEIWKFFL
jgi:hypothetical protein